jgi:phage FluMu protein Com
MAEVRCPTCGKLLAEDMKEGVLTIRCRCKTRIVVDRRPVPR